ncbi:MAG: sugar ABC transporter substrate-binding protein [Zetaproteobacteria bacterium]|nr:MAG: sugar ABC transporter substrate-binding protein [Zetaproteobacteria bacterium]
MKQKYKKINFKSFSYLIALLLCIFILSDTVKAEDDISSPFRKSFLEPKIVNLRPGDVLVIDFPGEDSFSKPFQIDSDGFLVLPESGRLQVLGKTIEEVSQLISLSLSSIYKDIDRISVILKERRLLINVLGYVKKPGPVNLTEKATVQIAINNAGGLEQGAQLDKIQVRRNNELGETEVLVFDYKKYLDTGDLSILPTLKPLDNIFVPASPLTGNVQVDFDALTLTASGDAGDSHDAIKVFGEVHRPGIFKYKEGASLIDMLMRAGGVTRYAGVEQIRVIVGGVPQPFNMREYMDTGNPELMPKVGKGDTVFVPQMSDQIKVGARTVYVIGEVKIPGAYETKEGATFFDILSNAGGPTRFAEVRQMRILRKDGSVDHFDFQAYTEQEENTPELPVINPGDAILVPEKTDLNEKSWLKISPNRAIMIVGAVKRPGRYEWANEMSLLDLIAHAGGPVSTADTSQIKIMPRPNENNQKPIYFDFGKFMNKGGNIEDIPVLGAGYTVEVPELPKDPNDNRSQWIRQESNRSIYIMGSVIAPGRYAFNENLNFLDILAQAQGPRTTADLEHIRISHRKENGSRVTKVNLALYFETGDDSLLPKVKAEDVIYLPDQNRAWQQKSKEQTVRVLGAVGTPGRYEFNNSMTILDLLAEAGGPRSDALEERIVVVNIVDGKPRAQLFDLVDFAKSGDYNRLPVLRVGDTIYVPDESQSERAQFRENLSDIISVVNLIRTLATGF